MKKIFFLLFFSLSLGVYSQSADAVLNKRLSEYMSFSKEMNIDRLMEYMYPRLFELAPREQLKEALEKAYHNPDIEIKLDSLAMGQVLPISKFSKGSFTKFSYTVKMRMKLLSEEMEKSSDMILQSFKTSFGEANVSYDEVTKFFWVYQTKDAIAIKDNYSKNAWTMLGLEKDQSINKIVPAEIKKKYNIQ
jgi:hypothetical protein